MPRGLTTVELFAGIGGFRLATDALGLRTRWANDHCPKAARVYADRFGVGELAVGDIRTLSARIPPHDLLTGGFPCQPFSSAGKKQGVRDPRGTLFESIIGVLARCRPRYFVLENVKRLLTMERGYHFATILSSLAELDYRIEWRLLNAMHFGLPQNRQRVFIVGVRGDLAGSEPSNLLLAPGEISADELPHLAIGQHGRRFPTWGLARDGQFAGRDLDAPPTATRVVPIKTILEPDAAAAFDFTASTRRWLKENRPVERFVQGVEILSNQAGGARMGYTIFGINGVAPTLTSTTSRHYERYKIGLRYRRLTNVEYARIQGFPDDHCQAVSTYEQYALLGNAVPPPVARWVIERLLDGQAGAAPVKGRASTRRSSRSSSGSTAARRS